MDPSARFAELVQGPEDGLPLDEAALLIAAHAYPGLDLATELGRLDELAAGCGEPSLEAWRRYLFVELGFSGNEVDYHDPANSFLNEVVRRRTGIPISLSVLAMEVGRRIGLELQGVGMPGHFLLRHEGPPVTFVDAFARGQLLDAGGCEARFRATQGDDAPFLPSYLDPVGSRAILARMLANLKAVYAGRGQVEELAWVVQLRLTIPGVPPDEHRDAARVLAARGRFAEAAGHLEALAELVPGQAEGLLVEARRLRARLN